MKIKVWTKTSGIVYTTNYLNINHFFDNTVMYENFFITVENIMINISDVIKAEEVKEEGVNKI